MVKGNKKAMDLVVRDENITRGGYLHKARCGSRASQAGGTEQ